MKLLSSILLAALALGPTLAAAAPPAGEAAAAQARKVHAVNISTRAAAGAVAASSAKARPRAAPPARTPQPAEAPEPVYDYASCGCS